MINETVVKEKAVATANSNRQSKRLPIQRSQFQYIIRNATFQAKHKNAPAKPCKAFEPENRTDCSRNFLNVFKRGYGEFKRIAAADEVFKAQFSAVPCFN